MPEILSTADVHVTRRKEKKQADLLVGVEVVVVVVPVVVPAHGGDLLARLGRTRLSQASY